MLELIQQGDRIVLRADIALAGGVCDKLFASGSILSRSGAGLDEGRRREVAPVEVRNRTIDLQGVMVRRGKRLPGGRKVRRIHEHVSRRDLEAPRPAYNRQALHLRLCEPFVQGERRLDEHAGIAGRELRADGAHHGVVSRHGPRDVGRLEDVTRSFLQFCARDGHLRGVAGNGGNLVTAVESLLEDACSDGAGGSEECYSHDAVLLHFVFQFTFFFASETEGTGVSFARQVRRARGWAIRGQSERRHFPTRPPLV